MFDWQDLKHFAVLARSGSLSGAARELGVDHATVGRRISALEQSLGLRLIDRLPRKVILTKDGEKIAELALQIEQIAYGVQRQAVGSINTPQTTVRISASPAVAARLIAPHVATFHRSNPGITLVLSSSSAIVNLGRGEADLAIRLVRPEQPELIARRIGCMRFGLYSSLEHAALPPESWSFISYDAALGHIPQQVWLRSLLKGRPVVFQAGDLFGQQEAARAGLGAAVLPTFIGENDHRLTRLAANTVPPIRELWLVTYPDLYNSGPIRTVMNFLSEIIGKSCPVSV